MLRRSSRRSTSFHPPPADESMEKNIFSCPESTNLLDEKSSLNLSSPISEKQLDTKLMEIDSTPPVADPKYSIININSPNNVENLINVSLLNNISNSENSIFNINSSVPPNDDSTESNAEDLVLINENLQKVKKYSEQNSFNSEENLLIPMNSENKSYAESNPVNIPQNINKERIVVEYIVLENFKSYAGRQVVGPFHESFSSVVGPNGSGKSNVIDGIMFVLGYRAKKMRQYKVADLVHQSEGTSFDSCTVEVHFRMAGASVGEMNDFKLVVSRTAWKSNRSSYSLNGQTCTAVQIANELRSYGVDLDHKRFLILQGEVEAIAMMRAKGEKPGDEGLLEYLEEIIGTNVYIEPLEKASNHLDESSLQHANHLLKTRAAEREFKSLEAEKETAESFLRLENKISETRSQILQARTFKSLSEISVLESNLNKSSQQLESENSKFAEILREIKEYEDLNEMAVKEKSSIDKEVGSLEKEALNVEKQLIKNQETKKHLKSQSKISAKAIADRQKQTLSLKRTVDESDASIQSLNQQIQQLSLELSEAQTIFSQLSKSLNNNDSDKHRKIVEANELMLKPLQDELHIKKKEQSIAIVALKTIQAPRVEAENQLNKLQARIEKVNIESIELQNTLHKINSERANLLLRMDQLGKSLEPTKNSIRDAEEQIRILDDTIREATDCLKQTETNNARSASLRALLREGRGPKPRIPGIHGRLGDLGAIDSKYDVAIATACGFLDHIVVQTTIVAQQCIEFLRTSNSGRANFIVMDKMKPAVLQKPNAGTRLFDLVSLKDPKYAPAMYFSLKETLVAHTVDEAQHLAFQDGGKKRNRVVTLDGKLFESSGTMSGGGQVRRGGMGSKIMEEGSSANAVDASQVRELKAQRDLVNETISKLSNEYKRTSTEINTLEEKSMRLEAEGNLVKEKIDNLPKELENLSIQHQKASSVLMEYADIKGNEHLILLNSLEKQISEIDEKIKPYQEAIDTVQKEILDSGGIKIRVQRSKIEGLQEQVELAQSHKSSIETKRTAAFERLKSYESDESLSETNKYEEQILLIDQEVIKYESLKEQIQKTIRDKTIESEKLQEQIQQLKLAMSEKASLSAQFRKTEYELRVRIEETQSSIDKLNHQINTYRNDLSHLVMHEIEGDSDDSNKKLVTYEGDDLLELVKSLPTLERDVADISTKLSTMQPNLRVLETYKEAHAAFDVARLELQRVDTELDEARSLFDELRRKRLEEFMTGLRIISSRLKELYQLLTAGGNAELELVDSLDPFSEGVLFSVMPPKKSWKSISNLSGGEKTLSSLALVFALHTYRPTPIYVMDEIDAALDHRNVAIIAAYIRQRTADAQFIVISLRSNMFELADRLVGIFKTNQRTASICMDVPQ